MIALERLIVLTLGELADEEAREVEEHVLACDECAARLERLVEIGSQVSQLVRAAMVGLAVSHELFEQLEREGLVTRTYRIAPGGAVACRVRTEDLYMATHLSVDLTGAKRVDLLHETASGRYRVEDVPFDRQRDAVVFVLPAESLKAEPTGRKTIKLIAVDDAGERVLAEYTLDHTAYSGTT